MLALSPFPWRRLTPQSKLEHRIDDSGALLLRGASAPPFSEAYVRDGNGGFVKRGVEALGFRWVEGDLEGGWMLRTSGAPSTMRTVADRWKVLVRQAADALGLDERLVLTTIACEAGTAEADSRGLVPLPRTERGYPRRTGERDPGDLARDAEDWAAFVASGGKGTTHASHGLLQTLVSTAVHVRPDLFQGVEPKSYRTVLWNPAASIACGAAYMATFGEAVQRDPLALRASYGAGGVYTKDDGLWGAVFYDDLVPMHWIAFWNDDACLRSGDCTAPVADPRVGRGEAASADGQDFVALAKPFFLASAAVAAATVGAMWLSSHFGANPAATRGRT